MRRPRRDVRTPTAGVPAAVTFLVGLLFVSNNPDGSDTDAQVQAEQLRNGPTSQNWPKH